MFVPTKSPLARRHHCITVFQACVLNSPESFWDFHQEYGELHLGALFAADPAEGRSVEQQSSVDALAQSFIEGRAAEFHAARDSAIVVLPVGDPRVAFAGEDVTDQHAVIGMEEREELLSPRGIEPQRIIGSGIGAGLEDAQIHRVAVKARTVRPLEGRTGLQRLAASTAGADLAARG